jgi:hypothetical protein
VIDNYYILVTLASLFQFSDIAQRAIIPRPFALVAGKFVEAVETVAVFVLGISHRKM